MPRSAASETAAISSERRTETVAGTESVPLKEALGRILAENVVAPLSVPPHANSAVDGYAVRFEDLAPDGETMLRMEKELVPKADAAVTVSETLRTKLNAMGRDSLLLTHGADAAQARAAVQALQAHAHPDLVVHNDLAANADGCDFPADIFRPDGSLAAHCHNRAGLAQALAGLLTS